MERTDHGLVELMVVIQLDRPHFVRGILPAAFSFRQTPRDAYVMILKTTVDLPHGLDVVGVQDEQNGLLPETSAGYPPVIEKYVCELVSTNGDVKVC